MVAEPGFHVPEIDWRRTARRVLTLEWLDGIKLSDRDALIAAGHDPKALAAILVRAFLRQAVIDGYFHADLHQGNLFALPDGRVAAIDFGIMGRIDRRARMWLAEILYGLITGNYDRVAEIHFEAQYVPPHHNVAEFATALRAVGEPIRGLPVKEISVGRMLEGLFAITRDFDMPTQPHLLLLQKTMVMEEGVATALDPDINMWETAEPFLKEWLRSELGPEAYYADRIVETVRAFKLIPDLIRKIDASYPTRRRRPAPAPARRSARDRAPALGGAGSRSPSSRRPPAQPRPCCSSADMSSGSFPTRFAALAPRTGDRCCSSRFATLLIAAWPAALDPQAQDARGAKPNRATSTFTATSSPGSATARVIIRSLPTNCARADTRSNPSSPSACRPWPSLMPTSPKSCCR